MKPIISIFIVLALIGGIGWYLSKPSQEMTESQSVPTEQETTSTAAETNTTPVASSGSVTVTYDGSSFTPATVTIHVGDTVMFVDQGSASMWVASAQHPNHVGYDGTTRSEHCAAGYTGSAPFDQCTASKNPYSFTFTKAGSWPYHDHVNASAHGVIIVQ